jgi:DnaJ-class molecular chaperone
MSRDYFAILGLTPGRYRPAEIRRRFETRRRRLLAQLDDAARHDETRQRLDELHRAYNALRDPRRQAEHARGSRDRAEDADRVGQLRSLIESSLEGGLLRYSRRANILAEGRRLGFSDFHTHLMIAQVQFGDGPMLPPYRRQASGTARSASRVGAHVAAAGVLALAIFLAMIRWLGT